MTPLHLKILLHYYSEGAEDYAAIRSKNDTTIDYAYQLAETGYLYTPLTGNQFKITELGRREVESILNYVNALMKLVRKE